MPNFSFTDEQCFNLEQTLVDLLIDQTLQDQTREDQVEGFIPQGFLLLSEFIFVTSERFEFFLVDTAHFSCN